MSSFISFSAATKASLQIEAEFSSTDHWLFRIWERSPPSLWELRRLLCGCSVPVLSCAFSSKPVPVHNTEGPPPLEILKIVMSNALHVHDTKSLGSGVRKLGLRGHLGYIVNLKPTWATWDLDFKKSKEERFILAHCCIAWKAPWLKGLVFGGGRLKHDWFQSHLRLLAFHLPGKPAPSG